MNISYGIINCDVIPLEGRKEIYHGFVVRNGKVCDVGDYDSIMEGGSKIINLQGLTVLPGFIDAHTHLLNMGLNMEHTDLSQAASFEEVKYYISKKVESGDTYKGWIIGIDFDESRWKMVEYPSKTDLDEISKDVPIVIKRICTHIAVCNSKALEHIGEGTNINTETGVIKEDRLWQMDSIIGITKEDKKEAIERGVKWAQQLGLTSIHEIVDRDGWEAYKELDEEGKLKLRVRCYIHHEEMGDLEPTVNSPFLALRGVKIFVDGSLGGRTAALEEDYEDDPGNRGMLINSKEDLEEIIEAAESRGFQIMAHAIGDRAISVLLDAFEVAATRTEELRHRIEHAEVLTEANIRRIRDLNLILSVQPNFAYTWSQPRGMNEKRLGPERLKNCNPYWDVQRALVKMAFGSDTMPLDPLFGVYSAVNHPLFEQRISTYNALQCYITNSAYAGRDEETLGKLIEGTEADFLVLSENPLESEDIKSITVVMSVINGEIVYDTLSTPE